MNLIDTPGKTLQRNNFRAAESRITLKKSENSTFLLLGGEFFGRSAPMVWQQILSEFPTDLICLV
jgi:hypothetical protein